MAAAIVVIGLLVAAIWSITGGPDTNRITGEATAEADPTGRDRAGADRSDQLDREDQPEAGGAQRGSTTDPGSAAPNGSSPNPAAARSSPTGRATEPELQPHERPLPDSSAAMIEAIDEAELAIRNPDLTNTELDSWGRRQQSLYRQLSFRADWAPEVIAAADPAIREAVGLNWEARQNLSALVNNEKLHDALPAWRVVAPLPPQTLIGYYKRAEAEHGIAWEFLAAINLVETRMGRIEGISTAGAIGPMQFLPTTWAECCDGDPAVPADAIVGAAKYLTIRGGPENMHRAIFGYNNSDYYVDAVTAYATVMMEDERAYYGYHAWEIYFLSTEGLVRLPVGYEQLQPIPVKRWLADHPDSLFSP